MQPELEVNHSHLSSVDIKNAWSCNSTSPYVFMAWFLIKHRGTWRGVIMEWDTAVSFMRFEVLTAVKMPTVVLWIVKLCSLVGGYQRFGLNYRLHMYPEYGGDVFLLNVSNHLQDYVVSQPRRRKLKLYL
jgi:hypothetical protein